MISSKEREERREKMRDETLFTSSIKVDLTLDIEVPLGQELSFDNAAEMAESLAKDFIIKAIEREVEHGGWREGFKLSAGVRARACQVLGRWAPKPKESEAAE